MRPETVNGGTVPGKPLAGNGPLRTIGVVSAKVYLLLLSGTSTAKKPWLKKRGPGVHKPAINGDRLQVSLSIWKSRTRWIDRLLKAGSPRKSVTATSMSWPVGIPSAKPAEMAK